MSGCKSAVGVVFALLFILYLGGLAPVSAQDAIPITTKSDEARQAFLDGLAMMEKVRFDEARDLFTQAIKQDPDFASAYIYRALLTPSAKLGIEDVERAVLLTDKITDGEKLLVKAVKADMENRPLDAIKLWERLVAKFPKDVRTHLYLGFAYRKRNQDDMAIVEFKKAIVIDKDHAPAYNSLGYAYREKGMFKEAEEAFKKYIRLLPDEANPYDSLGDLYTKMGRFDDAIKNYKKALKLNDAFVMSQKKIGDNLVFKGKLKDARDTYHKAIEMEVTPAGKIKNMTSIAYSFVHEGKYEMALTHIDKALRIATEADLSEQVAWIHLQKSHIYAEFGEPLKADKYLTVFRKVVMDSDLGFAFKEKSTRSAIATEAFIAAKKRDWTLAFSRADDLKAKIIALDDPKELEKYESVVGFVYFEKGDYAKAIEHLKKGTQESPYWLYLMAVAESELGNKTKANELFSKVANWNQNSLDYAFVRIKAIEMTST